MAELNLQYYKNIDEYSDGDVEDDIYRIVENGGKISEKENRYAVLYHLSPIRENILNWYPFKPNCRILEIGAGCGAITGMLCRKAETVVSVELSKKRASINYLRHQENKNLQIFVGNLNDMEFQTPFDYVVLNGVLEYAMSFTPGETPYIDFLKNIKKYLKDDGRILIAIENRLGLRYFSGYPEEHTKQEFLGLRSYEGNHQVRTFSRYELQGLLKEAGFGYQRFYYPYPDYKFPNEIFTDERTEGYGKPYLNLCKERYEIFEENKLAPLLEKEGVAGCFSNSFLVDACGREIGKTNIQYVKMNNDRFPQFCTATIVEEEQVKKIPLTKEAEMHLKRMQEKMDLEQEKRIHYVALENTEDGLIMPFLHSKSLDYEVEKLIAEKKADKALEIIQEFFEDYFKEKENECSVRCDYCTEEFKIVFGQKQFSKEMVCARNVNIDLILDNIFRSEKGYLLIDGEWIFPFDVPILFVIWRTLNELYSRHTKINELISRADAMTRFQIDAEMENIFWNWSTFFVQGYVGGGNFDRFVEPMQWLDIQKAKPVKMCSSLYIDTGKGYSEDTKLYQECLLGKDGEYEFVYQLPNVESLKKLRWDPEEEMPCICNVDMFSGEKQVSIMNHNADAIFEGKELFLNADPHYEINVSDLKESTIHIKGKIRFLKSQETVTAMQKCENWNYRLDATLDVKLMLSDGSEQLESFCQVVKLKAESYEFVYQIPDCGTLKELRWHLNNEGVPCVCSVNVSDDTGKTVYTRCVGEFERTEMGDVLISGEAYYLILGKGLEGKQLKICVKVHLFNVQEAIDFIKSRLELEAQRYRWLAEEQKVIGEQKLQEMKEVFAEKERQMQEQKNTVERLYMQEKELLQQMQQTRGWKVLEKLRKVKHKLAGK